MDYDAIIHSTFNWLMIPKVFWVLAFFWLVLSVFVVGSLVFSNTLSLGISLVTLLLLYCLAYCLLIFGLFFLTCFVLKSKHCILNNFSVEKFLDSIFLIFSELFFIFVWNKNKKNRFVQILLLLGFVLLRIYLFKFQSLFIVLALIIFGLLYIGFVIYNTIRLSFSLTIFYHTQTSIKKAINESWRLTHNKFLNIFCAYLFSFMSASVIFLIASILFYFIVFFVSLGFFTIALSQKIAFSFSVLFALPPALISYYFGFIELYFQLIEQNDSDSRIKQILAKPIINKESTEKKSLILKTTKVINKKPVKKIVKKSNKKTKTTIKKKVKNKNI